METDKRITWMRENIPGFKAMHDQAESARQSSEENRKKLGHLLAEKKPAQPAAHGAA